MLKSRTGEYRMRIVMFFCLFTLPLFAEQKDIPKNLADSVGSSLSYAEYEFVASAEAMPEAKYSFVPTQGNFKDARTFAEQVKHVACANYGFFNQIEGKTPPEHCEKGGPAKATTKTELLKYLRDSFDYGNKVLATINEKNALDRVNGPYAGPNTRVGMAITAVWHISVHYGQIAEYLRMNDIIPPPTQQYLLKVR